MVQILVLDDYLTSSCLKYQWCALVHLASPECSRLLGLVLLDSVNSLPPSACIPHTLSGHTENRNDNATLELARRAVRASVVILRTTGRTGRNLSLHLPVTTADAQPIQGKLTTGDEEHLSAVSADLHAHDEAIRTWPSSLWKSADPFASALRIRGNV
ncbi:hypothetical protein VTN49DRAFT_7229 [Thermomyces lanuginosus]|uniref:uncharacterized protein n=1 Tax=Thermomyces lanuginosus TaxID=5541 RepID=UPI00374402CF